MQKGLIIIISAIIIAQVGAQPGKPPVCGDGVCQRIIAYYNPENCGNCPRDCKDACIDIRASCTEVPSLFNVARPKDAYITCRLIVNDVPDHVWAAVTLQACTVASWAGFSYTTCLEGGCGFSSQSPEGLHGKQDCNISVPANSVLDDYQIRVLYTGKYASDVGYYVNRLISNFSIINDSSVQCPDGQAYGNNMYCSKCAVGTYEGAGSCKLCPLGSTGKTKGATSCTPCPPGWYGGGGATSCTSAPPGYFSMGNTYRSTACAPGTFAASYGSIACTPCANGTYSCAGATSCSKCAAGRTSSMGSPNCYACPPGTYAASGAPECTPCPVNTYSPSIAASSSTTCRACPSGTFTSPDCSFSSQCCV